MGINVEAFEFVDDGRSYSCSVEPMHGGGDDWWWFGVSGDRSRYAPFRAVSGDTQASVRAGVLSYYQDRVARRGWSDWRDRGAIRATGTPS